MPRSIVHIFITSLSVVILDQLSKFWAERAGVVTLNSGVSFGWLQGIPAGWMTLLISLVWLAIAYYLIKSPQLNNVGRGLVIGGGLANIIDRMVWGGVRDWMPIPGFNLTNNLADYALVVGCIVLIWTHYQSKPRNNENI